MIHQAVRPVRRRRRAAAVLFTSLLTGGGFGLAAAPSAIAAGAQVTFSPGTADPDYATSLQLRGSGFQSVQGGFGGIYVLFGWVDTKWRPSQGGTSGVDFIYVQDTETKDNHGFQRFINYPGDPTSYAANGGELHADGTWSTTLIVPGSTFPARGRNGGIEQIDCRKVQCGIITIGGHGVVSPNNETFTPITFAAPQQAAPTQAAPTQAAPPPAAPTHSASGVAKTPAAAPTSQSGLSIPAASSVAPTTEAPAKNAAAEISAAPVASTKTTTSSALGWVLGAVAVLLVAGGGGRWWLLRRARRTTP